MHTNETPVWVQKLSNLGLIILSSVIALPIARIKNRQEIINARIDDVINFLSDESLHCKPVTKHDRPFAKAERFTLAGDRFSTACAVDGKPMQVRVIRGFEGEVKSQGINVRYLTVSTDVNDGVFIFWTSKETFYGKSREIHSCNFDDLDCKDNFAKKTNTNETAEILDELFVKTMNYQQ